MSKTQAKDNICPHCLSKLVDENGAMKCTGSKLRLWQESFINYKKMTDKEKNKYLIEFSDSERFITLFKKWDFVDVDGNRSNFECEYTSKIFNSLPDTRLTVPDPLQVKSLERALGRELTEEELIGHKAIIVAGEEVELITKVFPDDF